MSILNNRPFIGAVVIGRNEGQRLITCLESLLNRVEYIVYVDSGSSDTSLHEAKMRGVECISLDMNIPFTAARARNEGARYLIKKHPDLNYFQFVDGDCEIQPGWIDKSKQFLDENSQYALVCGRRRERFPDISIYNALCDIEWNTPVGDTFSCGGDVLTRVSAFQQVAGYTSSLIAGEEPELCFRIREKGWKIRRLDIEMTLHDAAMTRFSQWWNRAKRAGYAYAEGCYLHGHSAERFRVKQTLSILMWSALLPILIVLMSFQEHILLFVVAAIYPMQLFRMMGKNRYFIGSYRGAFNYALSNVLGKFPQFFGLIRFLFDKWHGRLGTLIEYK